MKRIFAGLLAGAFLLAMHAPEAQAGNYNVLYSFCSKQGCNDGSIATGDLVSAGGKIYGVTEGGGRSNAGTIFAFNPQDGTLTTVYTFLGGADGVNPVGSMIKVKNMLYGTTIAGGGGGAGTVFAFNLKNGAERVVHAFAGGADGASPSGGLVYVGGQLWGLTSSGGDKNCGGGGCGTYFILDPNSGAETLIPFDIGGFNGANPSGNLIYAGGNFVGVTNRGGDKGAGTAFSIDGFGDISPLHSFLGGSGDGASPIAGLTFGNNLLYGTTPYGGNGCGGSGCGIVFSVTANTYNILHYFAGGTDSASPTASLLQVKKNLYGTASQGGGTGCFGGFGCGTIFAIKMKNGSETILHAFQGGSDGAYPAGGLIEVNGMYYGTTSQGGGGASCTGAYGCGTLYSIQP